MKQPRACGGSLFEGNPFSIRELCPACLERQKCLYLVQRQFGWRGSLPASIYIWLGMRDLSGDTKKKEDKKGEGKKKGVLSRARCAR